MGSHCCQNIGMTTLDEMTLLPISWNDDSGWDAIVAKKKYGMIVLDGMPLLPRVWNDNSAWVPLLQRK
eukprot:6455403-Amphidinium_carterae.1